MYIKYHRLKEEKEYICKEYVLEAFADTDYLSEEYAHWHNSTEILFAQSGSVRLSFGKSTYDMKEGEVAVIRSCEQHALRIGYCAEDAKLFSIRFESAILSGYTKYLADKSFILTSETVLQNKKQEYINISKNEIQTEYAKGENCDSAIIISYITALYLTLVKMYKPEKEETGTVINADFQRIFPDFREVSVSGEVNPYTMKNFQKVIDYTDTHFTDTDISLSALREVSGLSEGYISELFPKIIGIRFKQYLNALRINHAVKLLSSKKSSIYEIAFDCGYETVRTFNASFKNIKKVTPTEYLSQKSGVDGGISVSFENMNPQKTIPSSVFAQNGSVSAENDPLDENKKVFYLNTESKNKVWLSFNVGMKFKAQAEYSVEFDVMYLNDVCDNSYNDCLVGINFYYGNGEISSETNHFYSWIKGSPEKIWHHVSVTQTVDKDYVPGLNDKFQIFAHPVNDVAVRFMLKNVTCRLR